MSDQDDDPAQDMDLMADDVVSPEESQSPVGLSATAAATAAAEAAAAAARAAMAQRAAGGIAAPVAIRRYAGAQPLLEASPGLSHSPPPFPELSQSVPAEQCRHLQRGGPMGSSSHNLLAGLGPGWNSGGSSAASPVAVSRGSSAGPDGYPELLGDAPHSAGASSPSAHHQRQLSSHQQQHYPTVTLPHSYTMESLRPHHMHAASPLPPQRPSAAIPIHPALQQGAPLSARARSTSAHQAPSHVAGSPVFRSGHSPVHASNGSVSPPHSSLPPQARSAYASPSAAVRAGWASMENGRRSTLTSGMNGSATPPPYHPSDADSYHHTYAPPPHTPQRRSSAIGGGLRTHTVDADYISASSWSSDRVSRTPLASSLASANIPAAQPTRARSQSYAPPPTSTLTARAQSAAAAAAAAAVQDAISTNPSRLLLSSSVVPASTKAALSKLEEYQRDVSRTVDEYKQLLVRLRSRRRQVLGTLTTSMRRLHSWMQVDKLNVLQELQTIQSELFDKEEAMLTSACILLKERSATLASMAEDSTSQMGHLVMQMSAMVAADKKAASSPEYQRLLAQLQQLPPRDLLDSLTLPPKQYALTHPQLTPHSAEHRVLAARLDACKTRYLAVARATDVEELIDRKARVRRVVQALEKRCAEQSRRSTPVAVLPPHADAAAQAMASMTLASSVAAASDAPLDSSPATGGSSLLDYSPQRDLELDFAKLMCDERTKEGRAIAKFIADLEARVSSAGVTATAGGAAKTPSQPGTPSGQSTSRAYPGSVPNTSFASTVDSSTPTASSNTVPSVPAPSHASSGVFALAAVSQSCFDSIGSFLSQLEASCMRDYAIPAAQRPVLRLLVQRTLFPRIWHLMLALGYEEDDLRMMPPLHQQQPEEDDEEDEDADGTADSDVPVAGLHEREEHLSKQFAWLRRVSPLELGIPPTFLKAPIPVAAAPQTPSSSVRSPPVVPGTPGRAPPSHKPSSPTRAPPTHRPPPTPSTPSSAAPMASRSYRPVIDILEELGQLTAPADMVSCLLAASKRIYTEAHVYTSVHAAAAARAVAAAGGSAKPRRSEALGADSFFPIFLYTLIQSAVPHWLHRLKAMQRFALSEEDSMAEPAYYLTTLEAALLFVMQATPENINPNKAPSGGGGANRKKRRGSSSASNSEAGKPSVAATELLSALLDGDTDPDPSPEAAALLPRPMPNSTSVPIPHAKTHPSSNGSSVPNDHGGSTATTDSAAGSSASSAGSATLSSASSSSSPKPMQLHSPFSDAQAADASAPDAHDGSTPAPLSTPRASTLGLAVSVSTPTASPVPAPLRTPATAPARGGAESRWEPAASHPLFNDETSSLDRKFDANDL